METRYLLPCSCGQKNPVEPGQAGQKIACLCGAALEVPTMLGMTALEPADPDPVWQSPPAAWGLRQGLVMLGAIIVVSAIGLEIHLYLRRPLQPTPEQIRQRIQSFTPSQSWDHWKVLRAAGPDPSNPRFDKQYAQALSRHRLWMGVVLIFAAGGIALIVAALLQARKAAGTTAEEEDASAPEEPDDLSER